MTLAVGCRETPACAGTDIVEHFKYGVGRHRGDASACRTGSWRVLPIVFADKLPNRPGTGYEKLGFIQEAPDAIGPIGTTRASGRFGVELVGLNCATCHVGTIRETPSAPRQIVLGMPANQMDLQAYARFLTACARIRASRRRRSSTRSRRRTPTSASSRGSSIASCHRAHAHGILERAKRERLVRRPAAAGPGRVDTFNPYKAMFGFDMAKDDTVGTADLPSLWNQRSARGHVAALGRQQQSRSRSGTRARRSAPARRRNRSTSPRSDGSRTGFWT